MKYIKLFENFNEPIDILNDIKTISYILEDDGYILSYFMESDELENSDVNKIKISIQLDKQDENRHYGDNYYRTKLLIDCNKYFGLLKEHLDYISPNKIIAYRESRGRYEITIWL
jgi:hypothetical protein